jgi:hypothetical protein
MPTSELTGLGDKFNSQIELSVFETVTPIMCVRTTMRILLTLDLFAAVWMACMLTCGPKILFTTTIPGCVSGACPTTMTQVITMITGASPALKLKSDSRLGCNGRNPAAAPILFPQRPCALANR